MPRKENGTVCVPTSKGPCVLMDRDDVPLLDGRRIQVVNGYPVVAWRRPNNRTSLIPVHTLLVDPALDTRRHRVIHLNGDQMDCRRENMRVMSVSEISRRWRRERHENGTGVPPGTANGTSSRVV